MEKVILARSDIISRLDVIGRYGFVSDRFLTSLLEALDTAGDNISELREAMADILSSYASDLERIRFELARIPVVFQVVKITRTTQYGTSVDFIGLKQGDYEFSLESALCPDWVPSVETLHHRDPVWCLCTAEQARNLHLPTVPCWSETDSLLDWIAASVATQTLDPVADTPLTAQSKIYQYIVENSPVKTGNILAQQFAGKSQTHRILRTLEAADKIEKIKHGCYIAI